MNEITDIFIEQGTDEWLAQRMGKFTASEIYRLMGKKELGKTGETYILEKVTEQLGGTIPQVVTKAMQHGTLTEPFARNHYEQVCKVKVATQPFFVASWCDEAGCSPDGIVEGTNNMIEIKCPYDPTQHIRHMMISSQEELKEQKPEYYWQIQMQLAVCECNACDFISYHEDFEGALKMMVMEVLPVKEDIELLKSRIFEAVKMKHQMIEKIKSLWS